jgi:polyhydroxyalkanoate synthesis regulator phasin
MTAVEKLIDQLTSIGVLEIPQGSNAVTSIIEQAKEMEKQREKSIFSIAYRMIPTEFGKEHCESEFEKFIQPNL